MLWIGEMPSVIVPCLDECLGIKFAAMALRLEEPDRAFTTDAVAYDANERLLGKWDTDRRQCSGKAGIAGGGGGKMGYGVHQRISLALGSSTTTGGEEWVVGRGEVDFLEILVVETAADLHQNRHATRLLQVRGNGIGESKCSSDLTTEGRGLGHQSREFDFDFLLVEREADDFSALVEHRFFLVRVVEGEVGDKDPRLIVRDAPVASSADESRRHLLRSRCQLHHTEDTTAS